MSLGTSHPGQDRGPEYDATLAPTGEVRAGAAERITAFYDQAAASYAAHYGARSAAGLALRLRRRLVMNLLDRSGGRVLDVGCGPGEMVPALRMRGCRFWGVDLSSAMLARAMARHGRVPGVGFARARAEALPYRDGCFDAVLSMGVLEYAEDDVRALTEMVRVLRHDGVLILTLGHWWSPYTVWMMKIYYPLTNLLRPLYRRLTHRPPLPVVHDVHHGYDERWVVRHLPRGVRLDELRFANIKVLPAPLDALLPDLDMALMRWLQPLGRGPLRWLGTAIIVKARKL